MRNNDRRTTTSRRKEICRLLIFHDYLAEFEAKHMRKAIIELFGILDTTPESRDPYLEENLAKFHYVNGGLFDEKDIEIPHFTDEIRTLLLTRASENFNWSEISPIISGAVFESTLNPETRRSGGMHYTSLENIHKVIDPLFFDKLTKELEETCAIAVEKTKTAKLRAFQAKLASLSFLDQLTSRLIQFKEATALPFWGCAFSRRGVQAA